MPCPKQHVRWTLGQQRKYKDLLASAAEFVMVSEAYDDGCMQRRNEWMVDRCDVLLAVWDGSSGGTANCVRYAERVGRTVVRINPRELGVKA